MVLRVVLMSLSTTFKGASEGGMVDLSSVDLGHMATQARAVIRGTEAQAPDVAQLLRCLIQDLGCTEPASGHLACHAAQELGTLERPPAEVLKALEAAVVSAMRPSCVRREAARASRDRAGPRALHRMTALVRRRWEWEASAIEMELLQLLSKQLKPSAV